MREQEAKRLKRLVNEVKRAPDTPAIISILAEDRELLNLAFRILTIQPAGDPDLFQDLDRICREAEATPALIMKRLAPAARALGLPGPEESTGDFYEVLGVSAAASPAAIRKAYLSRARDLHPDIHPDIKPQEFATLAEAYRVLSSPDLREAYDARQQKVDTDWAERSPVFMEEAEKRTQGHQRRRWGLVIQLGLVLLAMIIGIGISSRLFEQQALREGSPHIQGPSDAKRSAAVPETSPPPAVQLAARPGVPGETPSGKQESGAGGRESEVRGQGAGSQRSEGRESGVEGQEGIEQGARSPERVEGKEERGHGGKIASSLSRPVSESDKQARKTFIHPPAPAEATAPVEAPVRPGPASGTRASKQDIPVPSDPPSPALRPKADPKKKDERPAETEVFAELEDMAQKASRSVPALPARKPAESEAVEARPTKPLPVKQAEKPAEPAKGPPPPEVEQPVQAAQQLSLKPPDTSSEAQTPNPPEPYKAPSPPPPVEQPVQSMQQLSLKPLDPSSQAQAPNPPEPSVASAPVREPARPEPTETRPAEPAPVKPAHKRLEPPKSPPRPVESPVVPRREIQDFIRAYCTAYENLNYARFMGYFAPNAVENGRSVQQLEAAYRANFERLEALSYDIQVRDCRFKADEIEVTGDYRLRWRYREDDWQEREGPIVLGLIPINASFQVRRLVYR